MDQLPELARLASTVTGRMILLDREAPRLVVHEWERQGVQHVAWPGDGQTPPYDAAVIGLKLFNYTTGQLRLIDFPAGARTPWHRNAHQDALFYGLDSTQVEFVDEATHHAYPGDASLHPEGVMHHSETIIGGRRVEFGFAPQGRSGHDLLVIPGRSLALHVVHEWIDAGEKRVLFRANPAIVPQDGLCFRAKLFQFPGRAILEAHYPEAANLPIHTNRSEKIVYVISGRLAVTVGVEIGEVEAGDVYRMPVDVVFARRALEPTVVIEVDGSEAPWMFTFPAAAAT